MSFLKISDPAKRDFLVEQLVKSKKNIQQNDLTEKVGDIRLQRDLTKLYKPITESTKGLKGELSGIKESSSQSAKALKALPGAMSEAMKSIEFPQYPAIEVFEDAKEVSTLELGEIATEYLKNYTSNEKKVDKIFGIYSKDGDFYIGDQPITIQGDDVTVGDKTYPRTPGLWELITMAKPDNTIFDSEDIENYAEILQKTNAISQPLNPNKPKSSRSEKYKDIIKPIWDRTSHQAKTGKGVPVIVIPQDPNALIEMLQLRMASFSAGNTGVRNEIIAICDELLRQGVISSNEYKKLIIL